MIALALALATPLLSPVQADDEALARASELRNASVEDWNSSRYDEAILKLRAADAIYAAHPGQHRGERAIALRAITWNEVRAGRTRAALETLGLLAEVVAGEAELEGQVSFAYGALLEGAQLVDGYKGQALVLEACRKTFRENGYERLAAQTLHDLAGFAGDAGETKTMTRLFEQAVRERKALGDRVGVAWSLNDLAYRYLEAGATDAALEPLGGAFALVVGQEAADPQRAVATNLARTLDALAGDEPERETVAWLWKHAELAAAATRPEVFASDRLLRAAMEADVRRKGESGALAAAKKLRDAPLAGQPLEVRADLELRAARVALSGGEAKPVIAWLEALDCGNGPCAPHLEARRKALLAEAFAARDEAGDYDRLAREAVAALDELGDREGRREALAALVSAGTSLRRSDAHAELEAAWDELRRSGGPGGEGASSASESVSDKIGGLGPYDPVFEIRWSEGEVVVEDLLGGAVKSFDAQWKPRHIGFNGLSIGLFGGYVTVRSMNYGGASSAQGARGSTSLDELGNYKPVPGRGALRVTKNGAVVYRAQ